MRAAVKAELTAIALTDHDSLAGIDEAQQAAAQAKIELIAGVELSVRDSSGVDDHLLGFFVNPDALALKAFLEQMQAERERMAERTIQALEQLGIKLSRERVLELASGAVITRPHIARAMVEAGYVTSEQEAFDKFLGSGKPAAQPRRSPDVATAIAAITQAGGVAGLAHPVFPQDGDARSRLEQLPRRLDAMRDVGMIAIECTYPDATAELTTQLRTMADAKGLIATAGSDYHGPGKAPNAPLGEPSSTDGTLEALRSARPARP